MKKKLSLLLCAALTAATLAGCGTTQGSPAGSDAVTEVSADGAAGSKEGEKILTYAVMEEPETLDPTLNKMCIRDRQQAMPSLTRVRM